MAVNKYFPYLVGFKITNLSICLAAVAKNKTSITKKYVLRLKFQVGTNFLRELQKI